MKYILVSITFVALFLFSHKANAQQSAKDTLRYNRNPVYDLQLRMFDIYKIRQYDIVMLGNSQTAGTNWSELLGRTNVTSRAIPGDILEGFAARMDYIYKLRPKIVFIMGGLNDLYGWIPIDEIFSNYIRIINSLQLRNIKPVIQSTTYAGRNWAKDWGGTPEVNAGRNREVDKLNKMLKEYAAKNNIDFIDLTPFIVTSDGYLRPELTWDGIHFKAEAYAIWAREIEKILQKYKM